MLRKIEIAHMMDAYEEEEFAPEEGGSGRSPEGQDCRDGPGPPGRTRRILLTAAVLAACLGLVGWTYGERVIQLLNGGQVTIGAGYGTVQMSDGYDEQGNPVILSLEQDRLWLVARGQRLDVTDQVDEKTPYVDTWWDEEDTLHYVIVGGTTEDYGWFEGIKLADGSGGGAGVPHSRTDLPPDAEDPDWLIQGRQQSRPSGQNRARREDRGCVLPFRRNFGTIPGMRNRRRAHGAVPRGKHAAGAPDPSVGQKAGEEFESPAGPAGAGPALRPPRLPGGAGGRPDPGKWGVDPAASRLSIRAAAPAAGAGPGGLRPPAGEAVVRVYPLVAPDGCPLPQVKLRKMRSQWGNCHYQQGYITLNTALARCPEPLRDYVALHELVHFLHHDHGTGFYAAMDARMPDWRARRQELKGYAQAIVE